MNGIKPSDSKNTIVINSIDSPDDKTVTIDSVFGQFGSSYTTDSKLAANFTFTNIVYTFTPTTDTVTGISNYQTVQLGISAAKNPTITKR